MKTKIQMPRFFLNDLNGKGGTASRPPDVLPSTMAGGGLKILSASSLRSLNFPFWRCINDQVSLRPMVGRGGRTESKPKRDVP